MIQHVYFIQEADGGPIKIGTAINLGKRLGGLQIGNHRELRLLVAVPCLYSLESFLHKRFAAGRLRGEWFDENTPGLSDLIASLITGDIPEWIVRHVRPEALPPPPAPHIREDSVTEWCSLCRWPIETELVERGLRECYRCISERVA